MILSVIACGDLIPARDAQIFLPSCQNESTDSFYVDKVTPIRRRLCARESVAATVQFISNETNSEF